MERGRRAEGERERERERCGRKAFSPRGLNYRHRIGGRHWKQEEGRREGKKGDKVWNENPTR